jgi:dihydroxyacid dehydratase/phosphogluconate dehydratase
MGWHPEHLRKPLVAVVNSFNELMPGHIHLNPTAQAIKLGIAEAGGTPEAFLGGPIVMVREGDEIRINIPEEKIDLKVPAKALKARKGEWKLPDQVKLIKGTLLERYRRAVSSAMKGCILE